MKKTLHVYKEIGESEKPKPGHIVKTVVITRGGGMTMVFFNKLDFINFAVNYDCHKNLYKLKFILN